MPSGRVTAALPSGTVTFLFTDIEGSTRRWEADPDAMRASLEAHDVVVRAAIEAHGGQVFKHTGDGMCAAFELAQAAVDAAIDAQRRLALPVRMGVTSGEAEAQEGDYFGPTLNRAARVMSAGHGGQILVAGSTIELVEEIDLIDLGPRRLRDLSEPLQLFQVRAEGLGEEFPPLKTVDTVPGNLPVQATSFIGRDAQVVELTSLVGTHRLVTLVGVGGVGKTRLALQVAAELAPTFFDGVWLVELAPLGDPASLPDVVATSLAVTPQAGLSVTESVAQALVGRNLLIVLDNCEHVLDAAAELVETILARTSTVSVVATSREALRLGGEHSWPVPSLEVRAGVASEAVSLFVERARAVNPSFRLEDPSEVDIVTQICQRLDGIALAIELAAARMVSMSAEEVRSRLNDRFRLLSGGRRGLRRHQTLRQAVQWSYDLLDDDERRVLGCCSVFADGFDLAAIAAVAGCDDEFTMLDLVDSLVRRSLVTTEQVGGRTRYGVLETIRQFAEEQLASTGTFTDVLDAHCRYFAEQVLRHWDVWDGADQRTALDWADAEFANLRAAFRWAAEAGDVERATAIAAHAALIVWPLQRFEPVAWAEEILPAAVAADVPQLPRLYVAASLCLYTGRPDVGVAHAHAAAALEVDGRHDPFIDGWSGLLEALAHLFGGRIERRVEICTELAKREGFARVVGLCGLTWALPAIGLAEEARGVGRRDAGRGSRLRQPVLDRLGAGRDRPGLRRDGATRCPRRATRRAGLRQGAPPALLGSQPGAGRRAPRGDPRRVRRRPPPVLERHRRLPPGGQHRLPGGHTRLAGGVLRSVRATRDRRDRVRRQHPAGEHQPGAEPPGGRRPPPLGARRPPVRRVRRHRRRPVDRRRGPVRVPATPRHSPRDRSRRRRDRPATSGGRSLVGARARLRCAWSRNASVRRPSPSKGTEPRPPPGTFAVLRKPPLTHRERESACNADAFGCPRQESNLEPSD